MVRDTNYLQSLIPKQIQIFYQNCPKYWRWAILTFAIVNLLSLTLAILLVVPFTFVSNPLEALSGSQTIVLLGFFLSLDFGSKALCVGLRNQKEPLPPILTRLLIGMLIGGLIPGVGMVIPYIAIFWQPSLNKHIRRGSKLIFPKELQQHLDKTEEKLSKQGSYSLIKPKFEIAGIDLPNYLENLGFFFVGSPGSGKTQAIKKMLWTMKQRPDFRAIILDRNGELMEEFFSEDADLIFNPSDARSLNWSHAQEIQYGIDPENIAASLVQDDPKDRFFSEAARSLLADLYERCDNNGEIWEIISEFSLEEIGDFLHKGLSARYFQNESTGSSVISTMVNYMRFYRNLDKEKGDFSFYHWGKINDSRWLWMPIFENESEKYKPLYTMAFELMLRGLLSNEQRKLKTALIIDELGALNQLKSLSRLLSESRKFGGTAILGTQTEAQIQKNYGVEDTRIILQGTATKLILNCRDGATAESMAKAIGTQEVVDITRTHTTSGLLKFSNSRNEQIRETYTVLPSEIQSLPSLEGYLYIADGSSPAKVKVEPRSYKKQTERFIPK